MIATTKRAFVRRSAATAIAVICLTPALASPAHASAGFQDPETDASAFIVISPEQYNSQFEEDIPEVASEKEASESIKAEVERVRVYGSPATDTPRRDPVGSSSYSTILWSDTDRSGIVLPTRVGTSAWGHSHYARRHNLTTSAPFRAIRNTTRPFVDQGAHKEYKAVVIKPGDPRIKMQIIMVMQVATRTENGSHTMPDGKYVGTVTAYCKDQPQNKCPAWVNSL